MSSGNERDVTAEVPWSQKTSASIKRAAIAIGSFLYENWFVVGICLSIALAAAWPELGRTHGYIQSQYTIKYGAVIVIFIISGMGLKTDVLVQSIKRPFLHLLVQGLSLGLTPFLGWGVGSAMLKTPLNTSFSLGFIVACAMPTTVSTNVVFTNQAGGNEACALINAVIGNIIGIFITPALLTLMVGRSSSSGAYVGVILQLCYTVVAPLLVGQILQKVFPPCVKWLQSKIPLGNVSSCMILLLVFCTFCDTFYSKQTADAGSIIVILFAMVVTFFVFSALCFGLCLVPFVANAFKIDRPDAVAVTICGATKTIALGIPVISVIYGSDPDVGFIVIPLITYHAVQCILGALMLPKMKAWVLQEVEKEDGGRDPLQEVQETNEVRDPVQRMEESEVSDVEVGSNDKQYKQ